MPHRRVRLDQIIMQLTVPDLLQFNSLSLPVAKIHQRRLRHPQEHACRRYVSRDIPSDASATSLAVR